MAPNSVSNLTRHRKSAADESWRRRIQRTTLSLGLGVGLALAAFSPVAAPAVVGLAHAGQAAPITAHVRPTDGCPSGNAGC